MGDIRNAYKLLVGKPEGKRPFGRRFRKCEDSTRMDLREKVEKVWTGFICLRIGTSSGLL
jgi:hypothetical protein